MKINKHSLVMSTELLRDGRQLSEEVVASAFDSMYDEMPLNQEHDLTKPAVGFTRNHTLERTVSGHLAIYADVHVNDGVELSGKGLSPAFSMRATTETTQEENTVFIQYNTLSLSESDIASLEKLSNDSLKIVRSPLLLFNEFDGLVFITLLFIGKELFGGFLSEAGKDAYTSLRRALKGVLEEKTNGIPESVSLTIQHNLTTEQGDVKVICEITQRFLEEDFPSLQMDDVVEYAKKITGETRLTQLGLRIKSDCTGWELVYFEDKDGVRTPLIQ